MFFVLLAKNPKENRINMQYDSKIFNNINISLLKLFCFNYINNSKFSICQVLKYSASKSKPGSARNSKFQAPKYKTQISNQIKRQLFGPPGGLTF
jgi:hypothetical protein